MAFWTRFLKRKSPLLESQDKILGAAGLFKKSIQWIVRQKPFWIASGLSLLFIIGFSYWAIFVKPYLGEKLIGVNLENQGIVTENMAPATAVMDTTEIPQIKESVVESRAEALALLRVAESHYQQGLTDQAKVELEHAIGLTSDTSILSIAYANLSNILDGEGLFDRAEQLLQRSLSFDRKFVQGYHNLGVVYMHLHEYDKAQLAFQVAIREQPDFAQAHAGVGEVHAVRGNFAEAIKAFSESLRLREDPNVRLNLGLAYLQSKNLPKAIEEFTTVQSSSQDPYVRYMALFNRAYALDASQRFEESIADYRAALDLAPKDVDALFNMGLSLMTVNKKSEALAAFRRVVELDRDNMDAYLNAVAMHSELGQYREALELLRPVHDRIPTNLRVNYQLGHLYHRVGKLAEAHEFFNKTLEASPLEPISPELKADVFAGLASVLDDSGALVAAENLYLEALRLNGASYLHYNLARTYRRDKKLDDGIREITKAFEMEPTNYTYVLAQAEVLFEAEYLTKAFDAYKLAADLMPEEIYPRFMMAHTASRMRMGQTAFNEYNKLLLENLDPEVRGAVYKGMGNIYHDQGDYSQAIAAYREGTTYLPKDANLFYNLARTYFQMERYDECYAATQKSINLDPKSTESHTLLGAYYFKKGLMEKAYLAFEEAVRLNPENLEAYYNRDVVKKYQ